MILAVKAHVPLGTFTATNKEQPIVEGRRRTSSSVELPLKG